MKTTIYFKRLLASLCYLCLSYAVYAHEGDTLKCHFAPDSVYSYMLYQAGNGGYICGVNGYGDLEIAQKYAQNHVGDTIGTECSVPDEHALQYVVVRFGAKTTGNPNDTVYVNIYSINHSTGGPDTLIATSFPVHMNFIDTSVADAIYTGFLMQSPVVFTDSFFVSVVLPRGVGDTLGIMSSTNGEADSTKLCWVKNSSGQWSTMLESHLYDIDAAIFPVVSDATDGINEALPPVVDVTTFPNPARGNIIIEYSLVKPARQLKFTIVDISGKVVYKLPLNSSATGKHLFSINTSGFSAGSYFYSFESDGKKYNGRLDILK